MNNRNTVKKEIEITGFKSVYYFEHGKEFYHAPEQHDYWEIVYVDKGEIIAVTDGMGQTLSAGQAIFHCPNDVHSHISNKKVSNNMFVVTFLTSSPAMSFFYKKIFDLDENSKRLLSLFLKEAKNAMGEVQGDFNNRHAIDFSGEVFGSTQLMAAYLEEFLIKLIRGGTGGNKLLESEEARRMGDNSTVALIKNYLDGKVYENVCLKDVCAHFFMGKSKLSFIFKKNTGKSPMQYLSCAKIEEAKKLLREGEMSVSEIADILRYSGIHSFTRAFKNVTGFSPTAYIKSIF
ncbi:MAG: helix-turn-helix domain-containing protein [Ruminococcaceae bacterium]|nr:helix-turn-helix domain-containing protein [Oscillospiraceae bacterium]